MRNLIGLANQPSTWRGLVWLLAAAGVYLSPDQANAVMAAGAAVSGLIAVLIKDSSTA